MSGSKTRTLTLPEGASTQPRPGDLVELGEPYTDDWDCGVVLRCAPADRDEIPTGEIVVWLSGEHAVAVGDEPLRPWDGVTYRWPKRERHGEDRILASCVPVHESIRVFVVRYSEALARLEKLQASEPSIEIERIVEASREVEDTRLALVDELQ